MFYMPSKWHLVSASSFLNISQNQYLCTWTNICLLHSKRRNGRHIALSINADEHFFKKIFIYFPEITTWAETKSGMLYRLCHPGVPSPPPMTFLRNHFNYFDWKSKKDLKKKKAREIHKKGCQRVSRVEWSIKRNFLPTSIIYISVLLFYKISSQWQWSK